MKELKLSVYGLGEEHLGHYLTIGSSSIILVHEELPRYMEYDTDIGTYKAWESAGSQMLVSSDKRDTCEANIGSMVFKLIG